MTINVFLEEVNVGLTPVRCVEPPCNFIATVRIVAFAGGQSFFGANNTTAIGTGGTVVGCALPCGDVFEEYEVTHLNIGGTASMQLKVTIPVSLLP
jgi:hypothetical protein